MTLYVTDLDGTLLKSDKSLSEYTKRTLNRLVESGVSFTYATARSFSSASPLVNKLKLNIPAVTFNGVFVVDPKSGRHIIENVFSKKALGIAESFIQDNALAPIVYAYIGGKERVSYLKDRLSDTAAYVNSRAGDKRLRSVSGYKELFEGSVFYITLFDVRDTEKCDAVFREENGFSRNIQADNYDNMVWYEIYSKNAGKEKAVLQLKKLLKARELVCFGDNFNDISMLKIADIGAAVENACGELKAAANVVIESNDRDGVASFIKQREDSLSDKDRRFEKAIDAALKREKGVHGSVGTQNEKLIHSTLKNFYAPLSDDQEIRIGNFFADAVSENGIFEIQSRQLYRLREKLEAFLPCSKVNVVYPLAGEVKTLFINSESGEVISETPVRKNNSLLSAFEEIYSIRQFLRDENLRIVVVKLKIEKRVYFIGEKLPDLRSRTGRKKCVIEKAPVGIIDEIAFGCRADYARLLPEGINKCYTKKEFLAAANDAKSSLRLEVLREAGVIRQIGKRGREYLYETEEL